MKPNQNRRVAVVVLGDLGRSPRMQYHALALAQSAVEVDVIGYGGSAPLGAVRENPRIRLHLIRPPLDRKGLPRTVFISRAMVRVFRQALQLLWMLAVALPKPDVILVQNPPAIPTLAVALFAARARSAKLVFDWHNFGYSMLALDLGSKHLAVRIARWYERALGRRANAHLCVSRAMCSELAEHWGIHGARVLYDRPAARFAPTPPQARRDLFDRLAGEFDFPWDESNRPALIVSPTSWTADEDFSILLEAAVRCDAIISRHDQRDGSHPFTHLLIVITGRGPLRARYLEEIRCLRLKKLHLRTLWLAPEDYPSMLGAADLGLCCHRSSSGLDLPMKLADLFGAGVPVLALDYGPCLAERVRNGENGLTFADAEQLAAELYDLFKEFPAATPQLDRLRDNLARSGQMRWDEGWRAEAAPVLLAG